MFMEKDNQPQYEKLSSYDNILLHCKFICYHNNVYLKQ